MIHHLRGQVRISEATRLVLDCGGVGYEIWVPVGTNDRLQVGQEAEVLTIMVVKPESHSLYGFSDERQRELFKLLMGVSGIGPRSALRILSATAIDDMIAAIQRGDSQVLTRIKGIGARTASRVMLELHDKMISLKASDSSEASADHAEDAILALVNLGYKRVECEKVVKAVIKQEGLTQVEEILKAALKKI